ncbi:nose resistant to fluoxetine protein 6-like isoform X1 [Frankliniella occidentalis]|uniref:Nose resistant to fluoxetine protein 6-like isoform X1 n=2 Tax=Frankliniella occidentalis TaxID=133901 RepID=A0A6J1TIT1_FRAOC|nr:nose resistant to fluoxetine protein 6-like isoform X1 [Frankliniella occidentalis]
MKSVAVALLLAVLALESSWTRADPGPSVVDPNTDEDAALREFFSSLSHPEALLRHVQGALLEKQSLPGVEDCSAALVRWGAGLYRAEQWALQMVDSSSKLITGVLYGNLADMGNFDECVASGSVEEQGFTGRYALPALDMQTVVKPANSMTREARLAQLHKGLMAVAAAGRGAIPETPRVTDNATVEYSTLAALRISVCVPSTCQAAVVEAALARALAVVNAPLSAAGFHLEVRLPERYTNVAGPWRKAGPGDYVVIALCVILILLVILGTTIDLTLVAKHSRQKVGMLLAFSAYTNGKRLLTIAPPSDSNFTCINGIRFLSAMWVVLGHRYINALAVPYMNLIVMPKRVTDPSAMMIASAPLSVDTFFLVGGMVNCYAFLKTVQGKRSFNFIMYYVHRYVRLTPAFALMIGITATWIAILGNGPLWYQVVGDASDSCIRNWWSALLYVANYATPTDQCMMQSWYLMVDMQLHWLSPLLLIPLWKFPVVGLAWGGLLFVLSCLSPFLITYFYELPAPMSTDISMDAQHVFLEQMYYPTHTRATAYIMGTMVGYALYKIKTGKLTWRLSSAQVTLGWLASTALCLTVIFGEQPLLDHENHPYNVWEASFYSGFHRVAWSIGIAWIVLACIMGNGGPINAFLSWTPFCVLGRLTYGIYLTHAAVQMVDHGLMRSSEYYTDFKMVEGMLGDLVLATFFGTCLCLTMESPIMAIEKALRGPPRRERPSSPPPPQSEGKSGNGIDNPTFVPPEPSRTPA